MKLIVNMIQGFCMALADSVPGVSGGTIAFILGFYDEFIFSLDHLVAGTKEERIRAIRFLTKLGAGWIIGFCASVLVLGSIFDSHIYELCSLFLGFSVFAVPLILAEEKKSFAGNYKNIIFTVIGIAVVVAITCLNPNGSGEGMDLSQLSIGKIIFVFFAGVIAISAMVLPGISGSTLLLIMGLYVPVMSAIRAFLHLDFGVVPILMAFGLGVITGIVACIRLVKLGLEKQRSKMLYLILGLVIGSLYAIVQGPTTLDVPKAAMTVSSFHVIFFLLGGVILAVLQVVKRRMEK